MESSIARPPAEDALVLQAPVEDAFITRNGALVTTLLPGQRVVSPQVEGDDDFRFDDDVELHVVNVPLQLLAGGGGGGGVDDPTKDLADFFGMSADVKQALVLAGTAAAILSGAGAVALAIPGALRLVGLLSPEPNPYDELYERINKRLTVLLKATLAGTTSLTMQNIAALSGHAQTSADIAADYLRRGSPADADALKQADYWSRYAATTLAGDAYWKRTFDVDAQTVPDWRNFTHGPVVVDNLVWDYRLALPAYLQAVIGRVAVIGTLDPEHRTTGSYRQEILGYVQRLRALELQIRNGIARALVPREHGNWKTTALANGVIDVHGGRSDLRSWHPIHAFGDEVDVVAVGPDPGALIHDYARYSAAFRQATELRFWRFYDAIGLFEFWKIIPDLEAVAGPADGVVVGETTVRTTKIRTLLPEPSQRLRLQTEWIQRQVAQVEKQ